MQDSMTTSTHELQAGHRQRLRERFMAGDPGARGEEVVLELLLTYALPHQDVQPIARQLLAQFGDLAGVLTAAPEKLCEVKGVKEYTVVLLKAVDWIKSGTQTSGAHLDDAPDTNIAEYSNDTLTLPLPGLLDSPPVDTPPRPFAPRSGTILFGKSMLQEAIDLLPRLPDTDSLVVAKQFLATNLHFNSQQTRERRTRYIVQRMFPLGVADLALRSYAQRFAGQQELRDACFYRFCKVEPIMIAVIHNLLAPGIGSGRVSRDHLKAYLKQEYPTSNSISDATSAILETLKAGGVARVDRTQMLFSYRDIPIPSLAFILHSEFPQPGIYDLAKIEKNEAMQAMLWRPDRLLPSLYELRNLGILAKVSEIDNVRQFTTRWTLEQVVGRFIAKA